MLSGQSVLVKQPAASLFTLSGRVPDVPEKARRDIWVPDVQKELIYINLWPPLGGGGSNQTREKQITVFIFFFNEWWQ